MILCVDDECLDLDMLHEQCQQQELPIFGGIFPNILYQGKVRQSGLIVAGLCHAVQIETISGLSKQSHPEFEISKKFNDYPSVFVFVDGLAHNIDPHLQRLFSLFGQQKSVAGGGAGSLSFVQKPCLFCNQGVTQDAMLVVGLSNTVKVAIGHGWEKLAGPFLANQVDDNQIEQLNFQPALTVYQEIVEQHSGMQFSEHAFFDIAKTYPFGIERLDDDVLVRDPITVSENTVVCVGRIPDNTMLYILSGEAQRLITASIESVHNAAAQLPAEEIVHEGFLFDCISRQLFLQDKFVEELDGISHSVNQDTPILGVLVLGEVASGASGTINFHNKTAVTALSCSRQNLQ
jgi:hypothetical protein